MTTAFAKIFDKISLRFSLNFAKMPCLVVNTNVSRSDIPSSFVLELSTLIAKLTGKPESVISKI